MRRGLGNGLKTHASGCCPDDFGTLTSNEAATIRDVVHSGSGVLNEPDVSEYVESCVGFVESCMLHEFTTVVVHTAENLYLSISQTIGTPGTGQLQTLVLVFAN